MKNINPPASDIDARTKAADVVAAKGQCTTFLLKWIAGARPPVHPEPTTGSQTFDSYDKAVAFMKRQAPDAKLVSLTERTSSYTDKELSQEAYASIRALSTEPSRAPDDLPWRISDIKRGLILFRTSNNAHGFTNFSMLTERVENLHPAAKIELANIMRNIAHGLSPVEPAQASFDSADWFYRDNDPDDSGDTPYEAIVHHPEYSVHLVHSSYRGDSRFVFRAPTLDPSDDDHEVLNFETEEEAIAAAQERKAEIKRILSSATPAEASHEK